MSRNRDFNPNSLSNLANERIRVPWTSNKGLTGKVSMFTIFLPRFLLAEGRQSTPVCTSRDEALLQIMLVQHFGGCTANPNPIQGVGRRGSALETNVHHMITVLASSWCGTWRYFKTLRRELEECSGEEQVLILHQYSTIV